jgi:hypothetical protein
MLLSFALLVSTPQLPTFETNPVFRASDILTPAELRSEDHVVSETVNNDGFMNHYVVETPFGDFEADGNRQLGFRIQEAHALAELDRVSNSDLFVDAAKRAVTAPVVAVNQFVNAPVDTVRGIPGGLSRQFRSISRKVKKGSAEVKEEISEEDEESGQEGEEGDEQDGEDGTDESSMGKTKTYAAKWFGVTGSERRWAQKLGVDPYSGNTVLRERIKKVAKVDAAASFGAKLAMPGLGAVSYVVTVSNLVWSLDGEELRARNLKVLEESGVSVETIEAFLDNPVFSPTHQTVIVQAMVEMQGVEGIEKALTLLDWVETETDAWYYADTIQLLSRFHQSVSPVHALASHALVPAVQTGDNALVFVLPVDHLSWNQTLADLLEGSFAIDQELIGFNRGLWLTGYSTDTARDVLSNLGWSVKTEVSID